MSPISQDHSEDVDSRKRSFHGNSVVISGVSTVTPGCENVIEFGEKLYKKENMVNDNVPRWKGINHPEVVNYIGKAGTDLRTFDAQYFMVYNALSHSLDVTSRKLLEHSFQAIVDAGVCPSELSGQRVAVFISTGLLESEKLTSVAEKYYGLMGFNKSMFANRISYYLNLIGPSTTIDASCCGSISALENAVDAIKTGLCDSAIVGAAKFILHPQSVVLYQRIVPLSPDGKMRCYDTNANGQLLSEAINVMYLQKYEDAKRVYARVCGAKCRYDVTENFGEVQGHYRSTEIMTRFLGDFYKTAGIPPIEVEYVDGFGAAIPEIDKVELEAMDRVFCKQRKDPLLFGSVTSNIGFTEVVSGLCSVTKILLAYQKGQLAANINCENPRQDVDAICDGRIKILTENHTFRRTFAAVNSLSLTGLNGHVLLQGCYKSKDGSKYKSNLPYLVVASGRQESSVNKILDDIKTRPIDPEEIALLHNIFKKRITKHLARGFGIYTTENEKSTTSHRERVDHYDGVRRPLWFVYSGMGSQWAGMGTDPMRVPVFAAAIFRCHKVLESKGLDLIGMITTPDETTFDNILHCFVGIAAIQIGLTEVLRTIGLIPDNVIGHSVGELGCAYADGCFTAEEMILMAYYRGLVSIETKFIKGSMAAVGLGFKQISKMCPPEIDVACHNSPNSCTISGPAKVISEFTTALKAQGIFAKEVKCANIAYHSRYIVEAGPLLLKKASEVVTNPKLRSERWISTSVPYSKWNEPAAKYSSAEYHTNNLLSPVLFEEMLRFIPSNAVVVEIAPRGLLQAILKRSLPSTCEYIPVATHGDTDNVVNVFEAIGKLYMVGYEVTLSNLYPEVEFPVSTATRPLSHMVEWYHNEKWSTCTYLPPEKYNKAEYNQVISIHDDDYSYLIGHSIQGRKVYPFAAALISAWELLAMTMNKKHQEISVIFQDVTFHAQPTLYDHRPLKISVSLQRGRGRFEVTYEQGVIAEGNILAVKMTKIQTNVKNEIKDMALSKEDIYKLFKERGYDYSDQFKVLSNANLSMNEGMIKWNDNWTTFIDGLIQLNALRCPHEYISQPTYINRLVVDWQKHSNTIKACEVNNGLLSITCDDLLKVTRCGGILMEDVRFVNKQPIGKQSISLKSLKFVPFFQTKDCDITSTLYVYLQILAENLNKKTITVHYISNTDEKCIFNNVLDLLKSPPNIELKIVFISKEDLYGSRINTENPDLIFLGDLLINKDIFEALYQSLPRNTFVLSKGVDTDGMYPSTFYQVVSAIGRGGNKLELAQWRPSSLHSTTTAITVLSTTDMKQLDIIRHKITKKQKLVIMTPYPPPCGIKEFVKQWREDEENNNIILVMLNQKYFEKYEFPPHSTFSLAFYVSNNDTWGGEYYIPTKTSSLHTSESYALDITQPGDLNSLTWLQVPQTVQKGIQVKVHYAALNTKDVKRAFAKISEDTENIGFGMDFSGITASGQRVMGLIKTGSVSSNVNADPKMLWPVPQHWTLEDAATVPLAYAHAFYCLTIKATLHPGMKVLIHGGAGGLGQAAISIALAYGCEVFTTVGNIKKKTFLKKLFPELQDDHIGNSRDATFGDMVRRLTNGLGCDIILSCVHHDLKNVTLLCCGKNGVTIDTEQLTSHEMFNFGMFNLTACRSYKIVDFSSILANLIYAEIEKLQILISDGIARGYVRPLSRVTYSPEVASRGFRLLSASRHLGRVLLRLQDVPNSQARFVCSSNRYQLIISNREDAAGQLADLLVKRGAKNIRIHCDHPSAYLTYKNYVWQKCGVQVEISSTPLNETILQHLLKECNRLGGIENIFVVLMNVADHKRDETEFLLSKLDKESQKHNPSLRNFVIVSDEAIAQDTIYQRSQEGMPSMMLQVKNMKQKKETGSEGTIKHEDTLTLRSALESLDKAILSKDIFVHVYANPLPSISLVEELAKILGNKDTNALSDELKLDEIGIDFGRAKELCVVLREKFNLDVSEKRLQDLTIGEFKNLQEKYIDVKEDTEGFGAFFNIVDEDELNAATDIIPMPTLTNSEIIRPDELDSTLDYLCIVPGLEGHYGRFDLLCERLKIAAVVLQPGIDGLNETIPDTAQRLVNIIIKRLSNKNHYYLLGYEFGVMIVLEMVNILEKLGRTCTVFFLGGTPRDIQQSMDLRLNSIENNRWEDVLITHMYTLMSGEKCHKLGAFLRDTHSWNDKVNICLKILRPKVKYSTQYIIKQIEMAYRRIKLMRQWNMQQKPLNSKIIVLRALLPIVTEDLCVYSSQDVTVYDLEASLAHAPKDLRCASIINRSLNPEMLEEYNNKNHCAKGLVHDMYIKLALE